MVTTLGERLEDEKKIEWARKPLLFILWSWTIKVSVKGS